MSVLCKSCRIFHNESNKIGFVFFYFFYHFLQILQDSAPSLRSRRDRFTNRPSNFVDRPSGRKFRLQLGPWRHGRRWELNSGEGKAQLGRERVGVLRGSPKTDSGGWMAPRACRRGGSTAPASGGRCELAFGEAAVRPDQYATLEAPGDPSEGG
jgi:hypothetical protein